MNLVLDEYPENTNRWDFSSAVEFGGAVWYSFSFQGIKGLLHFSYKVRKDDICLRDFLFITRKF